MITLTIIGIVAAITLPSLLVNVNDKAWNAQRKALYARMSQAIGEMDSISGYGSSNGQSEEEIKEGVAEAFIIDGLSKVYRVQNVCNKNNLTACGIPSSIITLDGNTMVFPKTREDLNEDASQAMDTDAAAFETVNGESIALFYNPTCESDHPNESHYAGQVFCVNMIYDLNGLKGPNEVGKDVGFITVLYRTNSVVVAPNPFPSDAGNGASYPKSGATGNAANDASSLCTKQADDARLPDRDELASMYINRSLLGMTSDDYWSASVVSSGSDGFAWEQAMYYGLRYRDTRSHIDNVRCVKR